MLSLPRKTGIGAPEGSVQEAAEVVETATRVDPRGHVSALRGKSRKEQVAGHARQTSEEVEDQAEQTEIAAAVVTTLETPTDARKTTVGSVGWLIVVPMMFGRAARLSAGGRVPETGGALALALALALARQLWGSVVQGC